MEEARKSIYIYKNANKTGCIGMLNIYDRIKYSGAFAHIYTANNDLIAIKNKYIKIAD